MSIQPEAQIQEFFILVFSAPMFQESFFKW